MTNKRTQSTRVKAQPLVIKWLRETAGLSIDDVSKYLNIKAETVKEWEQGDKLPTLNALKKLAVYYNRPLAAFLLPEPPTEPKIPQDFRRFPSEQGKPLSRKALIAIRKARYIQSVATDLIEDEELVFTALTTVGRFSVENSPEDLSKLIRSELNLSKDDQLTPTNPYQVFRYFRGLIEGQGIVVYQVKIPPKEIRGFSLLDSGVPLIAISGSDAIQARIFTLFHEYAHILIGVAGICTPEDEFVIYDEHSAGVEKFCNHFAGALLLPKEYLQQDPDASRVSSSPNSAELVKGIAHRYKVSRPVVLRRLLINDFISKDFYDKKITELESEVIRPRPTKVRISAARRCLSDNGKFFTTLALSALASDRITYSDVADYLTLNLKHLDKIEKTMV